MGLTRLSDHPSAQRHLDENDVPRDGWGRPLIVPLEGGKEKGYTRTTTFIDCIEDKSNLDKWGKRMVLVGVREKPGLLKAAEGLDPGGEKAEKDKLNALAEVAVKTAGAHEKRDKGSHLHTGSEYVDKGLPLPPGYDEQDVADLTAYWRATAMLDFTHIERLTVCEELRTAGTPDRLGRLLVPGPDGEGIYIVDLKTGNTDYGGLKMAMQLAIYSRSEFYDYRTGERTPFPEGVRKDKGIIIGLRPGSAHVDMWWIDLELGWEGALLAQKVREMRRKSRKAMTPFTIAA